MSRVPRREVVRINGFGLFYEEGGAGEAVVFLHGGVPSLRTLIHREEALAWTWGWELDFASEMRFIWYDRRGCYRSSAPTSGYDLRNLVEDLRMLLDHLQVDECHVIGSSAGGPISILFAATFPGEHALWSWSGQPWISSPTTMR